MWVIERDGLDTAEKEGVYQSKFQAKMDKIEHTVCDNDRYSLGNGLLGYTKRQVVR